MITGLNQLLPLMNCTTTQLDVALRPSLGGLPLPSWKLTAILRSRRPVQKHCPHSLSCLINTQPEGIRSGALTCRSDSLVLHTRDGYLVLHRLHQPHDRHAVAAGPAGQQPEREEMVNGCTRVRDGSEYSCGWAGLAGLGVQGAAAKGAAAASAAANSEERNALWLEPSCLWSFGLRPTASSPKPALMVVSNLIYL